MQSNKIQEGRINRSRTIDLIRNHPGISRIEAAQKLGLNRSTLTHIVNDLLKDHFIREEKTASSGERGGRIPIGLKIVDKAILGIEWQDRFFRFSVISLTGEILEQGQQELLDHSYDLFHKELEELLNRLEINHSIFGIAIGMPGIINPHKGIVLDSLPLGLKDVPLAQKLEQSLGKAVLLENDANCFAWGEIAERKTFKGNLLCMLLEFHSDSDSDHWDQEVGIGVVCGGEVYHGSSYSAGELMVSPVIDSLRNDFLKILDSDRSEEAVASLEYCSLLFRTLNPVISTLDPELLILGGDFFLHRGILEESLKNVIPFPWKFSEKGIWEVASGAASFFIHTIFSLPDYQEHSDLKGCWEDILKYPGGQNAKR